MWLLSSFVLWPRVPHWAPVSPLPSLSPLQACHPAGCRTVLNDLPFSFCCWAWVLAVPAAWIALLCFALIFFGSQFRCHCQESFTDIPPPHLGPLFAFSPPSLRHSQPLLTSLNFLSFFDHIMRDLSSLAKDTNPNPLQWKLGVLTTGTAREVP